MRTGPAPGLRAWWVLVLLCSLYLLSLVDRLILSLLVSPMKQEMALTDGQLGLLFGTAFAVVYCLTGVAMGRAADRGNRRWLIIGGSLLWSASTAASAFASNFPTLLLCRAGLAIGEAALVPCAYSLFADIFPPHRRVLATAIFVSAGAVGGGLSLLFVGLIINAVGALQSQAILPETLATWRLVLLGVSLPSFLAAFLFAATVREPARVEALSAAREPLADVVRHVADQIRTYAGLFAGGFSQAISFAFVAWAPVVAERQYGMPSSDAGVAIGLPLAIATFVGIMAGPLLAERLRRGRPVHQNLRLGALFLITGGLAACITPFAPAALSFILLYCVAACLLSACGGIILTGYQLFTPARVLATMISVHLMINYIGGLAVGPPLAGWIGEHVFGGATGLGYALSALSAVIAFPMAAVMLWSSRASSLSSAKDF